MVFHLKSSEMWIKDAVVDLVNYIGSQALTQVMWAVSKQERATAPAPESETWGPLCDTDCDDDGGWGALCDSTFPDSPKKTEVWVIIAANDSDGTMHG